MEFSAGPPPSRAWLLLLLLPGVSLLGVAWVLLVPPQLSYTLDAESLAIDARLGGFPQGRVIPRAEVAGGRRVRLGAGRRTMGTGMPGYCQGRWRFDALGAAFLATDCRAEVVALDTADGTVVISPPDRDRFLAALASGGADRQEVPMAPPSFGSWALAAGLVAGLGALAALVARLLRPLVYRVGRGELAVPRHVGELRVPLAGTRVREGSVGGAIRLAGSGMPGLHLGAYRNGDGGFHVAASRLERGVWVDGPRRVFVSPEDVPAFLEALRREGAVVEG